MAIAASDGTKNRSNSREKMTHASSWKSIPEVIELLNQSTKEEWNWKKVLVRFLQQDPETVTIFVPSATQLERIKDGVVDTVRYGYPLALQVVRADQFIEHLLMGFDLESACAQPLAMVGFDARFRPLEPIAAATIRFSMQDIDRIQASIVDSGWKLLLDEIRKKHHPQLAALIACKASEDVGEESKKAKKSPYRKVPVGGNSLTPLLWEIFYDMYEESLNGCLDARRVPIKPGTVMAILKSLADQTPSRHPLVCTVAGGIRYEQENGVEKELNNEGVRGSIRRWRDANPELFSDRLSSEARPTGA